eukprot:Sspe_Gene.85041::Locus_55861_Transcript_1_1_Confidence_1.000_Length_1874::g.85041::m.85041
MALMWWQRLAIDGLVLLAGVVGVTGTVLGTDGDSFTIDGKLTYADAADERVHGLLLNSRMIEGIFDDENEETLHLFQYPDSGKWDPERNTREFIGNMSTWRGHGMLAFTVGLQGGNPFGYTFNEPSNITGQPWVVAPYDRTTGALNPSFFARLHAVLTEADRLGMVVVVQLFYYAQIKFPNNNVIRAAINNTLDWLGGTPFRNFMIEVANECNLIKNDILGEGGMPETIRYIREYTKARYLLGASTAGRHPPSEALIEAADVVLVHGNGLTPKEISRLVGEIRNTTVYKQSPKPIMFNEDDHYAFDQPENNMKAALTAHASWGIFVDCNKTTAMDYIHGYQCVPSAWNINTPVKRGFFSAVSNYTRPK